MGQVEDLNCNAVQQRLHLRHMELGSEMTLQRYPKLS